MPYYSTESDEHKINIGEKPDPDLELGMEMEKDDWDAWDKFIDECMSGE
jgi:hypothetical protein